MKAYKCDICGEFVENLPMGVVYNNASNVRLGKTRCDLCPKCLDELDYFLEKRRADLSSAN